MFPSCIINYEFCSPNLQKCHSRPVTLFQLLCLGHGRRSVRPPLHCNGQTGLAHSFHHKCPFVGNGRDGMCGCRLQRCVCRLSSLFHTNPIQLCWGLFLTGLAMVHGRGCCEWSVDWRTNIWKNFVIFCSWLQAIFHSGTKWSPTVQIPGQLHEGMLQPRASK